MERTELPRCGRNNGFGNKSSTCVGCDECIDPRHTFLFSRCVFTLDHMFFTPCGNHYHPKCIAVGNPIRTRLVRATVGIQYPPPMTRFPFICEACPGARTYLNSRSFTATDVGTDVVDRHGACLGVLDAPGDGPTPWKAWKFRTEIWNITFSCCPYYSAPALCSDPFNMRGAVIHPPNFHKDRGGNKVQHSS
jgi:hypothetical protein